MMRKCWKKLGNCLACGSNRHRIANCPTKRDQEVAPASNVNVSQGSRTTNHGARVKARVYHMTTQKAPESSTIAEE